MQILSSHGNNGVWINIKYSKLSGKLNAVLNACAESTEKRLDSQVKLYRIIIKVRKIMFHPHQNFDPCHFFDPHQNFVDPHDPFDRTTLFSILVRLIWTSKTMVQLQRNSTTDISLKNIRDLENLFWIVASKVSKVIETDKKHFQSWQDSQNIDEINVILMPLSLSTQIAWP